LREFEKPATFPDFTRCRATAREPDVFWSAILHNGGPGRGFSEIMPSFREALTDDEVASGERIKWDPVRPFQVTLSRRQHIRANIGYRWAINLKSYNAEEPQRFSRYFEAACASSMQVPARAYAEQ